jgi:hypothetical protein
MSPIIGGFWCPNKDCQHFAVIPGLPPTHKSFDEATNSWSITCLKCGTRFTATVADLKMEQFSQEWLEEEYGLGEPPGLPKPNSP